MAKGNLMINDKIIPNDTSEIEEYELAIVEAQVDEQRKKIQLLELKKKLDNEYEERIRASLSKHLGKEILPEELDDTRASNEVWGKVIDEASGKENDLIRPSHNILKYSLIKKQPELSMSVPKQKSDSTLEYLLGNSITRASEIVKEYNSESTKRAHEGDLIYWQAWLSAIGFPFTKQIGIKEILSFIVEHVEGLQPHIDKKLVDQKYKYQLGPHKLATVKRRIASLSVFLDQSKWPNPCHEKEVKAVLSKLTKKYGGSKPAGKAITRYILDDMLDTSKDLLIDIRDKALLLFAWGSGGRRRSEVVAALMKDLVKNRDGDYTYTIPRSKTDQEGKGNPVPLKGRVAYALEQWLASANITDGHIFRAVKKGGNLGGPLDGYSIHKIVRNRLKKAGYDETQFGAHSLRSGFVTEAGRRNKPLGDVMQMTTHKNLNTVMKYYQAGNIINNSAANLAD